MPEGWWSPRSAMLRLLCTHRLRRVSSSRSRMRSSSRARLRRARSSSAIRRVSSSRCRTRLRVRARAPAASAPVLCACHTWLRARTRLPRSPASTLARLHVMAPPSATPSTPPSRAPRHSSCSPADAIEEKGNETVNKAEASNPEEPEVELNTVEATNFKQYQGMSSSCFYLNRESEAWIEESSSEWIFKLVPCSPTHGPKE